MPSPTPTPPAVPSLIGPVTSEGEPNASMYPASGSVTGTDYYCSAMYIIEQSLDMNYKRIPRGGIHWQTSDISLTGVQLGGHISWTALGVGATVRCRAYVVSGECWTTSSFVQPQRFTINTTSSIDGISYGTVDAGTFGPMGTVWNAPSGTYYSRVAYTDTTADNSLQPLYEEEVTAYNIRIHPASACIPAQTGWPVANPRLALMDNGSLFSIQTGLGHGFLYGLCFANYASFIDTAPTNMLMGAYSTDQDYLGHVISTVDGVGFAMMYGWTWADGNNQPAPSTHYNPSLHTW